MFWNKNDNGDWCDGYEEELWKGKRRFVMIGGVALTVVFVMICLIKGVEWQKTALIAISGLSITAGLWLCFSFELIAAWTGAKLAKLVKKFFKIKDE